MKYCLTLLVLLLLAPATSYAQSTSHRHAVVRDINLNTLDNFAISEAIVVWEDSNEEDKPAKVLSSFEHFLDSDEGGWRRYDTNYPGKSFTRVTLWAGLRIINNTDQDWSLILENSNLTTRDATAFLYRNGELLQETAFGQLHPAARETIRHRYYLVPLKIKSGDQVELIIRVRVAGVNRAVLNATSLRPESAYLFTDSTAELLTWSYFGCMVLLAGLSGVAAWIMRQQVFTHFSLFVIGITLVQFNNQGYARLYWWRDQLWLGEHAMAIIAGIMSISFVYLSRDILNPAATSRKLDRFFPFSASLILVLSLLTLVAPSSTINFFVFLIALLFLIIVVAIIILGALLFYRGDTETRLLSSSWIGFSACIIYFLISSYFSSTHKHLPWGSSNIALLLMVSTLFIVMLKKLAKGQIERDRARAESNAKSDFLAKMSHEIRTPMNGVLGMAELLSETNLDETQRHYSNVIYNSGRSLLNVINEILDYSKIRAGKMSLEQQSFDIIALSEECCSLFTAQARDKQLELICRLEPGINRLWEGDETRIRQIIINLLGNAVKFTDSGEVQLHVTSENNNGLAIVIKDTGIGIREQQIPRLFQDFSQGDASTSRKYGGTGLGLTICKQLVEMMAGTITVASRYGLGSEFTITLPLQALDDDQQLDPPLILSSNPRLLMVDDNANYRLVVRECLQSHRLEISEASNARIAREMITEANQQAQPFELIAIDINMPDEDGISLAKSLFDTRLGQHSSVVLLSSTRQLPTTSECESWGVTLALPKPILAEELYRVFVRLLGAELLPLAKAGQLKAVEPSPSPVPAMNILVAEDNYVNYQVVATMLKKSGHRVHRAENGLEALVEFKSHNLKPMAETYDFIFMDCEMPEMDGFDATRSIRHLESSRSMAAIPIVALTAHATDDRLRQCIKAGMDLCLSKPVQREDLQRVIGQLVAGKSEA